jgi:uncharacterized protein (DUF58 family)
MLTARGWWFLFWCLAALALGLVGGFRLLTLAALTLLLWLGWAALVFALRVRLVVPWLRLERQVRDERGPVASLWAGQSFEVHLTLHGQTLLGLPFARVTDLVPFSLRLHRSDNAVDGPVGRRRPLTLSYRVRCPFTGLARFEGARLELADLQGMFYHAAFIRQPIVLRILPPMVGADGTRPTRKRYNLLPPPGLHRLRRPGSGSELLDLRDYMAGDPPKTIAWKVSARRDKLITKEFESEVPVRCTLFVDVSNPLRLASPRGTARARLTEIAAGLLQANAAGRDLTGVCLFDDAGVSLAAPDRRPARVVEMLRMLAEAAALPPSPVRVNPEALIPTAYSFAQEVYPELLRPGVNAMTWYQTWVAAFPGAWRHPAGFWRWLYRRKERLFVTLYLVPIILFVVDLWLILDVRQPLWLLRTALYCSLAWLVVGPVLGFVFLLLTVLNFKQRRLARWRKQLAALLSVRYALGPGGLPALLEDEDQLSLLLQRFLAEHHVPYALPLYDRGGRFLFAAPRKARVLADALLRAVGKGHDNELFVLLADLLELDGRLKPLLRAVRVALARHHQVVLIVPWPPGLALPDRDAVPEPSGDDPTPLALRRAMVRRFQAAYRRLRKTFGRLGVPVVCAASGDPVPLVLEHMDALRGLKRRRR